MAGRWRRQLAAGVVVGLLVGGAGPVHGTASTEHGRPAAGGAPLDSSVERLGVVPGTAAAVGMARRGSRLFVLNPAGLLVFDVTDPVAPVLAGRLDLPARRVGQNLQVSPDGSLVVFRDFGLIADDDSGLVVVDSRDPSALRVVGAVPSFDEDVFCLDRCRWLYGSSGTVIDLRVPARPRITATAGTARSWVRQVYGRDNQVRNVRDVRPGLVTTAPVKGIFDDRLLQIHVVDVRDPQRPKRAGSASSDDDRRSFPDAVWPAGGRGRFQLVSSVFNGEDLFCTSPAPLYVLDMRGTPTRQAKVVSRYTPRTGTYSDGSPAATTRLSCGGGSLEPHPAHGPAGGLVAYAEGEHGLRILALERTGALRELGWALTPGVVTTDALWASDNRDETVLYVLDDTHGIQVMQYLTP